MATNYLPVSLLSVVSKIFEKLTNNMLVDHLKKCDLFSNAQYGFRSYSSTADHLKVASDRNAKALNRSGAPDISKAFDTVYHVGLLYKLNSDGISGQIFNLVLSFLSNRRSPLYKCQRPFDLRQQLELVSELESELQDSKDWRRK